MTDAESRTHDRGLSRRAWTRVSGILPVTAVGTIAAVCLCALIPVPQMLSTLIVGATVLAGVLVGVAWNARSGAEAVHRRVALARAAWAGQRHGAEILPDGHADPRDVALALPRGWRVESARGRVRFAVVGTVVGAETWVLKAVVGSRRAPRRREVVRAEIPTLGARVRVPLGAALDSLLVTPAWAESADAVEPPWLPEVRDRIARHDDLLASLTIGDDRVILFALDDPRPATMLSRAELVRDVAAIIQAAHSSP